MVIYIYVGPMDGCFRVHCKDLWGLGYPGSSLSSVGECWVEGLGESRACSTYRVKSQVERVKGWSFRTKRNTRTRGM